MLAPRLTSDEWKQPVDDQRVRSIIDETERHNHPGFFMVHPDAHDGGEGLARHRKRAPGLQPYSQGVPYSGGIGGEVRVAVPSHANDKRTVTALRVKELDEGTTE